MAVASGAVPAEGATEWLTSWTLQQHHGTVPLPVKVWPCAKVGIVSDFLDADVSGLVAARAARDLLEPGYVAVLDARSTAMAVTADAGASALIGWSAARGPFASRRLSPMRSDIGAAMVTRRTPRSGHVVIATRTVAPLGEHAGRAARNDGVSNRGAVNIVFTRPLRAGRPTS